MRRGNEASAAVAAGRQRDVVVGGVRGHRTRARQVEKRQHRENGFDMEDNGHRKGRKVESRTSEQGGG